jgi:hypothetical protein
MSSEGLALPEPTFLELARTDGDGGFNLTVAEKNDHPIHYGLEWTFSIFAG